MNAIPTAIPDVLIIEPSVFCDARGYFLESFNARQFAEQVKPVNFVQDNESQSRYGVIRGLHYQIGAAAQAKLVRAVSGEILDIAVDLRRHSPSFRRVVTCMLSAENKRQLFIPRGFAHGFVVLSQVAIFAYKCDNYYQPQQERGIIYNDAQLNIDWQIPPEDAVVSAKDKSLPTAADAECFD